MINERIRIVLGIILVFGISNPVFAEVSFDRAEAKAQILKSSQDWADVLVSGDASALETLLSDDMVGTAPNGRLYTKREFIDRIKMNPPGLASNKVNAVKIRFFGNVAVAQGSETAIQKDGKSNLIVWTDIYELRAQQWVIVAAQDVMLDVTPEHAGDNLFSSDGSTTNFQ